MIQLRNVKTIEQVQQRSLFTTTQGLRIHSKGSSATYNTNNKTHYISDDQCLLNLVQLIINISMICLCSEEKAKPFTAVLKSDTNLWSLLIGEMCSGKVIAEEFKDPGVIQLAMQNVLLIDAYVLR